MDLQQETDLLGMRGNTLLDHRGNEIATVSDKLGPQRVATYIHLFAAAPELLKFLEDKVSSALESANEQMKPRRSVTGYTVFLGAHSCADIPEWVEQVIQVIALAYGEDSNIEDDDLALSISTTEDNALQESNGEIVIRLSRALSAQTFHGYIHLFRAAQLLLQIVEATAKEELAEISREYESGRAFDPLGADESHFIIPDRLRALCDLVAKAKGAAPMSVRVGK
jgi:hypothetical protein